MTHLRKPPILRDPLRALLRIIHRANEQKDLAALTDAQALIECVYPKRIRPDLRAYTHALRERQEFGDRGYRMYSDDDLAEIISDIDLVAYGNFNEAMEAIKLDLGAVDRYKTEDEIESNVFRPELFKDAADRDIFNEMRTLLQNVAGEGFSEERDNELWKANNRLREYQQKAYGGLIPTLLATYIKKTDNGSVGVSVRLAWYDECLHVATHAPFTEELDDFFINQSPVESFRMFTRDCFPRDIGGYNISGVSTGKLYEYEL